MSKKFIIIIGIIISIIVIGAIIAIIIVFATKNDDKEDKKHTIDIDDSTSSSDIPRSTDNTESSDKIDNPKDYHNNYIISEKIAILNNGNKMPILGLGTWTLSNDEAEESVYVAIKEGYRLIDTAEYYRDEVGVGKGVKKSIEEGIIKREDVFITTKIMPGAYSNPDMAIEDSLKNLDVDYIDLMLIHQPGSNDEKVYKSMEKYYKNGKLKSIGISNYYTKSQVDKVLSYATIIPAIIQNENHIYYQNNELQEYVRNYGIIIESWYPFGGRGHTSENFNNEVIVSLANKYKKTSAQIILRWNLQAEYIVIPGSKNPDHIKENYNIFDFELSSEDMEKIYKINKNQRYENW
jgi:diketogulonate reductase-like aldo/keto reductase